MSRVVMMVVLTTVLAGCSRSAAPPAAAPGASAAGFQVSWEVHGEAGNFTKGIGSGGTARVGKNALEIKDSRAFVNGKDAGALKSGDALLVDKEGRLFVNGEEKTLK